MDAKKGRKMSRKAEWGTYDPGPYALDLERWPEIVSTPPGPKSQKMHDRASSIMRGYSGQVKQFPVVFSEGEGCTLKDVDGNRYIDFSSGIYVTNLGHCHPKVSEAVAEYAHTLMNCHDFTTPIKLRLLEKLREILPGDLGGVQLYDSGTTAVEAGLRACRAATGNFEFISCFKDFHGKSMGSVSLARMNRGDDAIYGAGRVPGFYMVPRPDMYRPWFTDEKGKIDTDRFINFYDEFILEGTTGQIAAFVLEPIQGWGGTIMPPDDFFPKLREYCDQHGILLMVDEILTGMGRTGHWLCLEEWGVIPDVVTLGKGFGNGFPVTAMVVRDTYAQDLTRISASTSYGGNPMACAAALACIEVIEEEGLLEHAQRLGDYFTRRMSDWPQKYKIVGDVRCKGCLLGVELVKDRKEKTPFPEAGEMVYRRAFQKGLAWIPAGHILRMSPPIVMPIDVAERAMDIIEESIDEAERELG